MLFEKGIDVDTTVDKKKTYTIGTTALMIGDIIYKLFQYKRESLIFNI